MVGPLQHHIICHHHHGINDTTTSSYVVACCRAFASTNPSQPLACKQRRDTTRHKPPHNRKNIFMTLSVNDVRYGSFSTKGKVMHHFRTLVFKTKQKEGEK